MPVLMLIFALATLFASTKTEDDSTASGESAEARLLQTNGTVESLDDGTGGLGNENLSESEETEPLRIITIWIFISITSMITFGYLAMRPLTSKLYKQYQEPSTCKIKSK